MPMRRMMPFTVVVLLLMQTLAMNLVVLPKRPRAEAVQTTTSPSNQSRLETPLLLQNNGSNPMEPLWITFS